MYETGQGDISLILREKYKTRTLVRFAVLCLLLRYYLHHNIAILYDVISGLAACQTEVQ
jgi:hypothetical protein